MQSVAFLIVFECLQFEYTVMTNGRLAYFFKKDGHSMGEPPIRVGHPILHIALPTQ